jgi:hypothetical protein
MKSRKRKGNKKEIFKEMCNKRTAQKKAHAGELSLRPTTPTGPPVAAFPLPVRFIPPRGYSQSRRRRPKPGAEAFVGLFSAGDELPPGTPTPSLPFPSCCAELSTETLT